MKRILCLVCLVLVSTTYASTWTCNGKNISTEFGIFPNSSNLVIIVKEKGSVLVKRYVTFDQLSFGSGGRAVRNVTAVNIKDGSFLLKFNIINSSIVLNTGKKKVAANGMKCNFK